MARLSEKLENGVNYLQRISSKVQEAEALVQKGEEVLSYWNPLDNSKREAAQREIENIKKRRKWLVIRYFILWMIMIFATWQICGRL